MADKYYRSSLHVTLPDGTKKQLRFTGRTQKEADKKRDKALVEYESGLLVTNSKTTFAPWCEEWLQVHRKPKMSDENFKQIASLMRRVYVDTIGGLPISSIRLIHVQKCINNLQGYSSSLINKAYSNIRNLFRKAVANGLINADPTTELEKPIAREKEERRELTEAEKSLFLKVMKKHRRGSFFGIMYACGLRPQEARALGVFDIDMDVKNVTVSRAIGKDGKSIKTPKSDAGRRTIPVPEWYRPVLKAVVIEAQNNGTPYLWVRKNGSFLDKQTYLRAWSSFLRMMDLEAGAKTQRNKVVLHAVDQSLVPYHLRHTYATELAEKEVPLKTAQYLLGHSNIAVTAKIYTHVTERMRELAREKIDGVKSCDTKKENFW